MAARLLTLIALAATTSALVAHQGQHPTGLSSCQDAEIALENFSLFGEGVIGTPGTNRFEPQTYRLVNLGSPDELPYAIAKISMVLGSGHDSRYSDYTVTVVLPTGVRQFNAGNMPGSWRINPLIHGWSGQLHIFATNTRCGFTLQATARWDLPRPYGQDDGCAPCPDLTCQSDARIGSVDYALPIGTLQFGEIPVSLRYRSETVTNQGAAALELEGPAGSYELVAERNQDGSLSTINCGLQVCRIAPDPVPLDPNRFRILVSSDRHDPEGSLFREVVIENLQRPDGQEALRVSERIDGRDSTRLYTQPHPSTWVLVENDLRRTTRLTLSQGDDTRVFRWLVEERDARGEWAPVEVREDRETRFSWGWMLTQRTLDPEGEALTSTWDYYEFGEVTGPDGDQSGGGRLKFESLPTGQQRTFQYLDHDPHHPEFAQLEIVREAFGERPLARERRRHLSSDDTTTLSELQETWIDGHLVEMTAIEVGTGGGLSWREERRYPSQDSTPLVTRSEWDASPTSPLLSETTFPDGTLERIEVRTGNSQMATTILRGVPNPAAGFPIVAGSESVTVRDARGQVVQEERSDVHEGIVYPVELRVAQAFDPLGRPTAHAIHHGGANTPTWIPTTTFGCCGVASEIGEDRIPVTYFHDQLGRVRKVHRNGISTETIYDGLTTRLHRYPESSPSSFSLAHADNEIRSTTRNLTGEVIARRERAAHDGSLVETAIHTTYAPAPGIGRRVVQTLPITPDDQGALPTITEDYDLEGNLRERHGGPVVDQRITLAATPHGIERTVSLLEDGAPRQPVATRFDWLGRPCEIVYAGDADGDAQPDRSEIHYDSAGRLAREVDPDGVTVLHRHDLPGRSILRGIDLNRDGILDPAVDEVHITRRGSSIDAAGHLIQWREQAVASVDRDGNPLEQLLSREEIRPNLLENRLLQYPGGTPVLTHQRTTFQPDPPGSWDTVVSNADGTTLRRSFQGGLLRGESLHGGDGTTLWTRSLTYNAHRQPIRREDSRGPTTNWTYHSPYLDFPRAVETAGRSTGYQYDARGRIVLIDQPDTLDPHGQVVQNQRHFSYFPHGGLRETHGDPGLQHSRTYDFAHRLVSLTTHGADPATTRWNYDPQRGWLTSKQHHGATSHPSFSYTAAGRLARHVNARGITTTLAYGPDGRIASRTHDDGTPPVHMLERDELGRVTRLRDASGTRTLTYRSGGELQHTTYHDDSPLAGWTIAQETDSLGRLVRLALADPSATLNQATYHYDPAGRLASVQGGNLVAHYHYHSSRQRVAQLAIVDEQRPLLFSTRSYDALNRLARLVYHNGNPLGHFLVHSDHAVERDPFGRITVSTRHDRSQWRYRYNASGELAEARHHREAGSPELLAGQNFAWSFDGVGNRLTSAAGGDRFGANLRISTYTSNSRNQLTTRLSPGFLEVHGAAPLQPEVMVNGSPASRQGHSFRHELPVDNQGGATRQFVTVTQGQMARSGFLPVPAAEAQHAYDADGNLTSDGQFRFSWDAENRLTRIETHPAAAQAGLPYQRVEFRYDSASRCIERRSYDQPDPAPATRHTRFLYAGWRCLGELGPDGRLERTFTWGLDHDDRLHLGDPRAALLWLHDHQDGESHLSLLDHHGNISGLLSATSGQASATYRYSPFGRLLTATGPYADRNPFRFSTQRAEPVGGLTYYGYRYYRPRDGTWLGRDPLAEEGDLNLYRFAENDPINHWDRLGLDSFTDTGQPNRLTAFAGDFVHALNEVAGQSGALSGAVSHQMRAQGVHPTVAWVNGALAGAGDFLGLLNIAELAPGLGGELTVGPDGELQFDPFSSPGEELLHGAGGIGRLALLLLGGNTAKASLCKSLKSPRPPPNTKTPPLARDTTVGSGGSAIAAGSGVSPEIFKKSLRRFNTPSSTAAGRWEIANTGPFNYTVVGGGTKMDVDGLYLRTVQEAKFISKPSSSPFIEGSNIPPFIRDKIVGQVDDEFARLGKIIQDSSNPLRQVEVIINTPQAEGFFMEMLKKHNLNGRILIR